MGQCLTVWGFNQVWLRSSNFFLDRNMSLGVRDFHWKKKYNLTIFSLENDTVIRLAPFPDILLLY
jgi:hypothetical protein